MRGETYNNCGITLIYIVMDVGHHMTHDRASGEIEMFQKCYSEGVYYSIGNEVIYAPPAY